MKHALLPPNAVLGVVGGGQLGRMFAMAAARIGYRVQVLDPEINPPAAQVAHAHTRAAYDCMESVRSFGKQVDAVTYEFENVPAETVSILNKQVRVSPAPDVLALTRNRITEKSLLQKHGIPVTPFRRAANTADCAASVAALGGSAVVKTTELGYDGKGQVVLRPGDDAEAAWKTIGDPAEAIVEQLIDLASECSVIVARDQNGRMVFYGPFHNVHRNHILDVTTWSAQDTSPQAAEARHIGAMVADALKLEGLICVELFVATDGEIMVNEIAPRPHNSGHLTIEACSISQFEQQARLTAGHPATEPHPRAPAAAMANLLGDLWLNGEPNWSIVLEKHDVSLHLYGKAEARPGRKMGHLTALAESPEAAETNVRNARAALSPASA